MRYLSLVLVAAVAVGCVRTSRNPSTGKMDVDIESPTKKGEDWKTDLRSAGNYTGIGGTSRAQVADGRTNATITVTGLQPGAVHPWHVHEGNCGSGGRIVGNPSDYTPLTVGTDGTARGSALVMVRLEEARGYHVNVHLSPNQMETVIACGNLDD